MPLDQNQGQINTGTQLSSGVPNNQPGVGYSSTDSVPLPLREAIPKLPHQYFKVLTKPSATTFAKEMGKAEWSIVWIQLIGYAIIMASIGFLNNLKLNFSINTPHTNNPDPVKLHAIEVVTSIIYIALVPLSFFIGMRILHLIAKAFGGQGMFLALCYTTLLFDVPLGIFTALFILFLIVTLSALGVLFAIAAVILGIYGIVQQVFAIVAVHRLSIRKATIIVLIPIAMVLVLAFGLFVMTRNLPSNR